MAEEPLTDSPTVFQRLVAIELVQMREKADPPLSRGDIAKALGCSTSKIDLLERPLRRPTYKDLQHWTAACGRPERLEVLWMRTTLGRDHGWWEDPRNRDLSGPESFGTYVGLEQGASRILLWDPLTVSGLLQTRATAESVIRAYDPDLHDDEVAERARLRIRRQDVLGRAEVHVILGEPAVRQPIGGNAVRIEQLQHLVELAEHPRVKMQLLPIETGAHSGQHGPFTILQFPHDPEVVDPGTVYVETLLQGRWYEDAADIAAYSAVHAELERIALAPDTTVEFLHRLIKEFSQ